jgi:hypothetical protein
MVAQYLWNLVENYELTLCIGSENYLEFPVLYLGGGAIDG